MPSTEAIELARDQSHRPVVTVSDHLRVIDHRRESQKPLPTFPLIPQNSPPARNLQEVPFFYRKYDPDRNLIDERFQQLILVLQLFSDWKQTLPILRAVNNLEIAQAGNLVALEVHEAMEELDKPGELNAQVVINFLAEITDICNIPADMVMFHGLNVNVHDAANRANGTARRFGIYDRIAELAVNLPDDKDELTRAIELIYEFVLSILKYTAPYQAPLVPIAIKKMGKNWHNYPADAYTDIDRNGEELDVEEQKQKYYHVQKCLKWLRSLYQPDRQLPNDWRLVKSYIDDFRNGDQSFEQLKAEWFRLHPELLKVLKPELVVTEEKPAPTILTSGLQ